MASSNDIATNANSIPTKQALLTAIDDIEIVALGKSLGSGRVVLIVSRHFFTS